MSAQDEAGTSAASGSGTGGSGNGAAANTAGGSSQSDEEIRAEVQADYNLQQDEVQRRRRVGTFLRSVNHAGKALTREAKVLFDEAKSHQARNTKITASEARGFLALLRDKQEELGRQMRRYHVLVELYLAREQAADPETELGRKEAQHASAINETVENCLKLVETAKAELAKVEQVPDDSDDDDDDDEEEEADGNATIVDPNAAPKPPKPPSHVDLLRRQLKPAPPQLQNLTGANHQIPLTSTSRINFAGLTNNVQFDRNQRNESPESSIDNLRVPNYWPPNGPRNLFPPLDSDTPGVVNMLRASERAAGNDGVWAAAAGNSGATTGWVPNNEYGAAASGATAPDAATNTTLIDMFSQTLASTFNPLTICGPKPFAGGFGEKFVQWWQLWGRCDQVMNNMRYSSPSKYLALLKCTSGLARSYIDSLSATSDNSYQCALTTLFAVFSDKRQTLRDIIADWCMCPPSTGSTESRLKVHSKLLQYKMCCKSINATPQDTLLAWELLSLGGKLDEKWARSFNRFLEKRRDTSSPLAVTVTFDEIIYELHRSLTEEAKQNAQFSFITKKGRAEKTVAAALTDASKPAGTQKQNQSKKSAGSNSSRSQARRARSLSPQNRPPPRRRASTPPPRTVAAVGGKSYQRSRPKAPTVPLARGGDRRSGPPCNFCARPGTASGQAYAHRWPRGCPNIRLEQMPKEEIKRIVAQKRLCRNCFMNHPTNQCDAPPNIFCGQGSCELRHHKIYHNDRQGQPDRNNPNRRFNSGRGNSGRDSARNMTAAFCARP